jgi:hypothetical protein
LNTQVFFLKKSREEVPKYFDDHEWLDQAHLADIPEDLLAASETEEKTSEDIATTALDGVQAASIETEAGDGKDRNKPKVRPIQVGEVLRRWISKRLLRLNASDISRVMASSRQLGVGTPGGAEALGIFHQLVHDAWSDGLLRKPLARIKVDEQNCFGMLEWPAIRASVRETLPKHFPVTCMKHAQASAVEQHGVENSVKDRGAEQGDVDGPLECAITLGSVAAETRFAVHAEQRLDKLPWSVPAGGEVERVKGAFSECIKRATAWAQLPPQARREDRGSRPILTDPRQEIQEGGGLADFWYLDDGDIFCDPRLVMPYLKHFDAINSRVGAVRNKVKTEVIYYTDDADLEQHAAEWCMAEVLQEATVSTAASGSLTLGVAVGPASAIQQQIEQKVKVVSSDARASGRVQ